MHKHVGMILVASGLGVLFFVPGAVDKLFALFFIGLVPYTHYTLPASAMLSAYALLLAIAIFATIHQISTVASATKRDSLARQRARKKVFRTVAAEQPRARSKHSKKHLLPATEN